MTAAEHLMCFMSNQYYYLITPTRFDVSSDDLHPADSQPRPTHGAPGVGACFQGPANSGPENH
jgi:hypothetical protein